MSTGCLERLLLADRSNQPNRYICLDVHCILALSLLNSNNFSDVQVLISKTGKAKSMFAHLHPRNNYPQVCGHIFIGPA